MNRPITNLALRSLSVLVLSLAAQAGAQEPPMAPRREVLRARDLGFTVLERPLQVSPRARLIARGPSPSELQARIAENLNAADTTNANQLWTGGGLGLNLNGSGLTVGIWDGGNIRGTHQELTGRVTSVDGGANSDHSTHVAGTIGATGVSAAARGMASAILIRSRNSTNDTAEMTADAGLINFSNHSYGLFRGWTTQIDWGIGATDSWIADRSLNAVEDPEFGKYSAYSQSLDTIMSNNPNLLSFWSAGNQRGEAFFNTHTDNTYVTFFSADPGGIGWAGAGYYQVTNGGVTSAPGGDGNNGTGFDSSGGEKVAKNTIGVGAINDATADPINPATLAVTTFTSFGPVDDGRVKPDVVANGNGLNSSVSSSNTAYAIFSGTSMSSPNALGTTALLVQHYRNLNAAAFPRSATMKGLIIHTAADGGNAGPDYRFGWGLIDAAAAASFLTDSESASPVSRTLTEATYSGSTIDYTFTYTGSGQIKATICWTDPPAGSLTSATALDDATPALVNDLDLTIIGPPGSTTYWPWTLNPASPTTAAVRTTRNAVDNVEQVRIDAPAAGAYTVRVSHTGASFNQAFSLLTTSLAPGVPPVINVIAADSTACGAAYTSDPPTLAQGTAPITWSLVSGPIGMTINAGNGAVSWPNPVAAVAPYSIMVQADNAQGSDTETWSLTVLPGDFDGDGARDVADIGSFIAHLLGTSVSQTCAADVNLDGDLNGADVQAFVNP